MELLTDLLITLPIADVGFAFRESSLPGKLIVLLLVLSSAGAWTIMLTKYWQLKRAEEATDDFLEAFRAEDDPSTLFGQEEEYPATPLNTIYQAGCTALGGEMQAHGYLDIKQLDALRTVVDRNVADEALILEEQMGLLATAVSAAPFLGLLGTVWGVMDAFGGMAVTGSATLSAVAPGISGALLTTVVGLLVALPSAIGYNLLTNQIRRISVQMDNFAQEFISETQRAYVSET